MTTTLLILLCIILACSSLTTSCSFEFQFWFQVFAFPGFRLLPSLYGFTTSACEFSNKDPISDDTLQDTLPDANPVDLQAALWRQGVLIRAYQAEVDSLKATNQKLQKQAQSQAAAPAPTPPHCELPRSLFPKSVMDPPTAAEGFSASVKTSFTTTRGLR